MWRDRPTWFSRWLKMMTLLILWVMDGLPISARILLVVAGTQVSNASQDYGTLATSGADDDGTMNVTGKIISCHG